MDQNVHARAIWTALDAMLEQDPEGYRRFVNAQLEEGRQMLRREGGMTRGNQGQPAVVPSELEVALSAMSLGVGDSRPSTSTPSEKLAEATRNDASKNLKNKKSARKQNQKKPDASEACLLDDEIGKKSILAQIVKKSDRCDSGDEEELELTTTTTTKAPRSQNKKKPLIEEI